MSQAKLLPHTQSESNFCYRLRMTTEFNNEPVVHSQTDSINDESVFKLLCLLPAALLNHLVAKIPRRIRDGCITVCGMIALFSPLLLWIAWNKLLLYLILSAFCIAIVILYVLIRFYPDEYF